MKVTSDNEAAPQQGVGVLASFSLPLAISAAAILASFVFSILIFPAISTSLRLDVDPDNYGKLALNIYGGVGFVSPESSRPEIARGPLYPYFVAEIYSLAGGPRIETVQAVQAVCHGAMCFLIYLIGARFLGRRIAVAAQALCAIHPMLIWYTARVWIETVHTLLLVAAVLLLLKFVERRSAGWALGAGVT